MTKTVYPNYKTDKCLLCIASCDFCEYNVQETGAHYHIRIMVLTLLRLPQYPGLMNLLRLAIYVSFAIMVTVFGARFMTVINRIVIKTIAAKAIRNQRGFIWQTGCC